MACMWTIRLWRDEMSAKMRCDDEQDAMRWNCPCFECLRERSRLCEGIHRRAQALPCVRKITKRVSIELRLVHFDTCLSGSVDPGRHSNLVSETCLSLYEKARKLTGPALVKGSDASRIVLDEWILISVVRDDCCRLHSSRVL